MKIEPISIDGNAITIMKESDLLQQVRDSDAPKIDPQTLTMVLDCLKAIVENSSIEANKDVDARALMAVRMKLSACISLASTQAGQIIAICEGQMTCSDIGFPEFDPDSPVYEE